MPQIVQEPAPLPVAIADVKAFLRIGTEEEDALIASLTRSAAEMCEAFTGRALIARDVSEILPVSAAWTRLGVAPVRSIDGVAALDAEGEAEALAAQDYSIDIDAAGDGWVRVLRAGAAKRVRVSYSAGMAADADGVPEAIGHGIVRLSAFLYTHRTENSGGPPAAVTALWRPWRRLPFGVARDRRAG